MINNELTRDFEKYFPLPWSISFYGDGVHYIETETEGDSGFWIMENDDRDTRKHNDTPEGRDALEYMVRCANLMPECVNMLKEADTYMTSMLVGLCNDCPDKGTEMCRVCKLKTVLDDIETLLAKLEGGAEE